MRMDKALDCIDRLQDAIAPLPTRFSKRVLAPDRPIKDWLNTWRPTLYGVKAATATEIMSSFGVYLIATHHDNEVIYVGKATPGARHDPASRDKEYHLAGRMFMHLGSPYRTAGGDLRFHRGDLAARPRMSEQAAACLSDGSVAVALVEIDPWPAASFVETYLQAAMLYDGGLPAGNERIG